jgi:GT2 family glycosyltransferase
MPLHPRAGQAEAMFEFLRRRAKPTLAAPLRSIEWDGRVLTLAFDDLRATAGEPDIALDIDGCFFSDARLDRDRRATFALAFSPSGRTRFDVLPRVGRDGAALAAQPLRLAVGKAGVVSAARTAPPPLAQHGLPARCVPFGVDVAAPEVAIVVPVYNAPDLVGPCLDAVLAHTRGRARLIVIDDASPDAAIAPLLAHYAQLARVTVLRNDANRGFTATANRGIALAGSADVVLLNADTQVGPNWLNGLRRAAYAGDDVATATAVSDNAGAFSVPELERANALPASWTFDDCARALWQRAGLAYPELPTGNGFCLYIRRTVVDAIGVLDEVAFAQGYGEENDFCQRAAKRGLRHVIAGNVLVRHARSQSFGEERRLALGAAGMAVLRERWPDYENDVGHALFSFERRVLDWRVRRIYADARRDNVARPRLLWVGAGAPTFADADVWNLRANGAENELVFAGEVVAANTWQAVDPEPSYRALWDWLQVHAIECLLVSERKQSAAEILCGLLDVPIAQIDAAAAGSARDALRRAESDLRSFPDRRA